MSIPTSKSFNLGSALMAIFIFFITGLFSWFGNETINNSKNNIRLASTNIEVVHAVNRLNITLERVMTRILKVEDGESKLSGRIIMLEERAKYRDGVRNGNIKIK